MTKTNSASDFTGHHRNSHKRKVPAEGTIIRKLYDLFRTGAVVRIRDFISPQVGGRSSNDYSGVVAQLQNYYGLEIGRLNPHRRPAQYQLLGEWEGSVFVPLEAILQEDMVETPVPKETPQTEED